MCLAVPLLVDRVLGPLEATARQGETELAIDISLVPEVKPGDYVIVHAGFAIQILAQDDAEQRIELLREITRDPSGLDERHGPGRPPGGAGTGDGGS